MIPVRGYENQKVAVLGMGRTGLATVAALAAGGAEPLAWDDNPEPRAKAVSAGVTMTDLTRGNALDGVAALVTSPGIPHLYPEPNPIIARAMAAGIPVDNDIGLFFRSFATPDWDWFDVAPKVVAVTGSNGKSTTSALIHHVLSEAGRPAQLGGNIGTAVLGLDPASEGEVVVLELSSYQTELARSLTPDVAAFINISPDHLDRHGGPGGYFAAKARLFTAGGPDRAVIGVDEPEGRFLAAQLSEAPEDDRVIRVSTTGKIAHGWSVTTKKGFLAETRKGRQAASVDLRGLPGLAGVHNHQNAAVAFAVCRSLGLAPRQIEAGFATFKGLANRTQFLGEKNGVRFVNDSKATNVQSAAVALAAFQRIRWIAGGQGKEGGIAGMGDVLGRVEKGYFYGASAQEFAGQVGDMPAEVLTDLGAAFAAALADATPGETILLAPAAASFDQFRDFEHRGDAFVALVAAHLAQA